MSIILNLLKSGVKGFSKNGFNLSRSLFGFVLAKWRFSITGILILFALISGIGSAFQGDTQPLIDEGLKLVRFDDKIFTEVKNFEANNYETPVDTSDMSFFTKTKTLGLYYYDFLSAVWYYYIFIYSLWWVFARSPLSGNTSGNLQALTKALLLTWAFIIVTGSYSFIMSYEAIDLVGAEKFKFFIGEIVPKGFFYAVTHIHLIINSFIK